MGLKCKLLWPVDGNGVTHWFQRTVDLSFTPRSGDRFEIEGVSYFQVASVEFLIGDELHFDANVIFMPAAKTRNTWKEEVVMLKEWGWQEIGIDLQWLNKDYRQAFCNFGTDSK